ncbi:alpha/beta fold hydrolase [Wenxinia marina]|uniref:Putative hydrolase or acyltransferase (Alpha/beta hydrolase superfamily) n=1 Tax=Wenxinia marina DSM 24838 TaxID=1123501 RepID=A0A0D0NH61_9RHOB|nr:alpha/beta fold hydrolase [Wenxinia marina]KIQ67655.1 putative hydrolase or acyltransferase (alpha/beta hydrolase superfamily) [Wenxinia marina DSM 24838]GGL79956.1 alpha/beta hydrolase [Wenxinia marina]
MTPAPRKRPRRILSVHGRRAACVITGRGAPLILLHGGAFDHADLAWGPVIPGLARVARVHAPDLPGYGGSATLGPVQTIPDLGRWVLALMDRLGLARASVAGLSMGGGVALWLALNAPGRVERLVLVSSYGLMERAPFHALARRSATSPLRPLVYHLSGASAVLTRAGLASAFANPFAAPAATVAAVRAVAREQARRQSFGAFLRGEMGPAGTTTCFTRDLARVAQPVLLLHGTRDPLVPVRHARDAARALPRARLVEMPSGHWPIQEFPQRSARLIAGFLGRR